METNAQEQTISVEQLRALHQRVGQGALADGDLLLIEKLIALDIKLFSLLKKKKTTLKQLRELVFVPPAAPPANAEEQQAAAPQPPEKEKEKKPRAPGHGRNSAADYRGAEHVLCTEAELKIGAACPNKYCQGHLQDYYRDYAPFIRLAGQPPIGATLYEQEIFRCSDCTVCFTAKLPEGVVPEKYSPSADATIVLYRYGFFVPFNRLANIQQSYGVPLPASVQWHRAEMVANCLLPVFLHLQLLAASGETLYQDDTKCRILRPLPPISEKRTGLFTTGLVIEYGEWQIALYTSGRKHAGENAAELLKKRPKEMTPINKMSDGSSMNNSPPMSATILNCLVHAREKFKKLEGVFTEACRHVIEKISEVYDLEEQTQLQQMTKEQRLDYHKLNSLPIMEKLRLWMVEQMEKKIVEPNDALGCAFDYFLDRFESLTQFTRILGAPLDNNVCERILRLVVLHRNNSLFYRNDMGAFVGDICMSLISTCRLNKIDPYHYLVTIIEQARLVRANPARWLPHNYQLNRLKEQKTG
jgi:transposase